MFIYLNKRGQSTLEYAVIIAVIVAALIAMQVYIKRGLQGKLKQASDDIGEQFSPGYTTANTSTSSIVSSSEIITPVLVDDVGMSKTDATTSQTQTRTSQEKVQAFSNESWE